MGTFGMRLKKLRNKRGITQEKLAKDLDIPESSIRRLEISDGVPRMERLDQIAKYFNKSTDFLLGRETKNKSDEEETERQKKIRILHELADEATTEEEIDSAIIVLKSIFKK